MAAKFPTTGRAYTPASSPLTSGRDSLLGGRVTIPALRTYAEHPRAEVRAEVARHGSTPADVMAGLASDPDVRVRRAAARHPHAAVRLSDLSRDEDSKVRYGVACNDETDPDVLAAMAGSDDNPATRAAAASTLRRVLATGKKSVSDWGDGDLLDGIAS